MRVLAANFNVLNTKLHNIHWNVVDQDFIQIHKYTDELYQKAFEYYDRVSELVKMRKVFPTGSLKETLEIKTIDELGNNTYDRKNHYY